MHGSWLLVPATLLLSACGAVFPEIAPPVKAPPAGRELTPPPPADLLYVAFEKAEIPTRTRDGRQWDNIGGSLPDPFAKLFVNDREITHTSIQSNTLKPTWPDQKHANYRIPSSAHVRVELWDSNPINNHTICSKTLHNLPEMAGPDAVEVECDSGAHMSLRVEPAHARWGVGFNYELRTQGGVAITRVLPESPAARAGLKAGEEVLEIGGKPVRGMDRDEAQSRINADAQVGIVLLLRAPDHTERKLTIKEGVIYPAAEDGIPLD
jgi:hypothetical protein